MTRSVLCPSLLVLALTLGAATCCGNTCSESLRFAAPVPDLTVAVDDTVSYELFRNVWETVYDCGGSEEISGFPGVEVHVRDDRVATTELLPRAEGADSSRLVLRGLRSGSTRIVLRASAEIECEHIYDATHFTLTVH